MRDPSQNPEVGTVRAQREIAAAILLDNDLYDGLGLTRAHFTDPDCQRVFVVASDLIEKGDRADDITIEPFLTAEQRGRVADFIEESGDRTAVAAYASLLQSDFQRRNLAALGGDMTTASQDASVAPDRLIEGYQDRLDELRGVATRGIDSSIGAAANRVIHSAAEAYRTGVAPGLRTGIQALDAKLQPMRAGQLIIGGGSTGQGKSVLGQTIVVNNARCGVASLIFSLEMKGDEFAQRLLAGESGVSVGNIVNGCFVEDEFRKLQDAERLIQSWPVRIETPKRLSPALLSRITRQHIRKHDTKLIVVDHIGLMRGQGKSFYEQVSDITRSLKEVALELDIPIIALAQLNRESRKRADGKDFQERYLRRRPKNTDLRDSGSIEQDADVVLLLHREEAYAREEEPPTDQVEDHAKWRDHIRRHAGKIDINITKQRQGQSALVACAFDGARFHIQ